MHCWVRLSTSYSASRTTWPESSAKAGVAPTPGRCFTRYTGFRWGNGSPINWLYWLTRCGPQPLQRISASWYRPMHHLGFGALPMLRCSSFLAYTPNWPVTLFLLLLHLPGTLYLLIFDCAKTFSLSNATWKTHLKACTTLFISQKKFTGLNDEKSRYNFVDFPYVPALRQVDLWSSLHVASEHTKQL